MRADELTTAHWGASISTSTGVTGALDWHEHMATGSHLVAVILHIGDGERYVLFPEELVFLIDTENDPDRDDEPEASTRGELYNTPLCTYCTDHSVPGWDYCQEHLNAVHSMEPAELFEDALLDLYSRGPDPSITSLHRIAAAHNVPAADLLAAYNQRDTSPKNGETK